MLLYSLLSKITSLENFYKNPKNMEEIVYLQNEFELDYNEAVLLGIILKLYFDKKRFRGLDVEELMDALNIETASKEYFELLRHLRSLSIKDIIIFQDSKSFRDDINIDNNVLNILLENKDEMDEVDFNDIHSVLDYLDKLYNRRMNETISLNKLLRLSRIIALKSKDFSFLAKYSEDEIILFFKVLLEEVHGKSGIYASSVADDLYDSMSQTSRFMQKIYQKDFPIIKDSILEVTENGRFLNDPELEINKTFYFAIFKTKKQKKGFVSDIVKYIPYKKINQTLFVDEKIETQINLITKAIDKKNFKKITKELKQYNLSSGIVALLYGYPGTGKTATAYYLSKMSKRDVLQVDISNIRDKYVGESEKRIKAIFNEYERAKKELKHEPILLFNEADSLIGKRMNTSTSVDVMNNTMQNILLEELEKFEGVFIATTNLTENMDDAFNRRFLYKIEYKKPSKNVRKRLWLHRLPQSEDFLDKIIHYELTGGQIENIARKALLEHILNSKKINQTYIKKLIEEEKNFKSEKEKKIGLI